MNKKISKFDKLSIEEIKNLTFTTKARAEIETGFSYLMGFNSSAKMLHGENVGIDAAVLYLAPANNSGVLNTCPKASPECAMSCIFKTGRQAMQTNSLTADNTIEKARINKTRLYFYNRNYFMQWLIAEITGYQKRAQRNGHIFAVRLNGTSDIKFENVRYQGATIFNIFPEITFYDYTKHENRNVSQISNYSLTFSYTGHNVIQSLKMLKNGVNVAIVFNVERGHKLPTHWKNYPVLDGDISDYRPGDKLGSVVGLRYKYTKNKVNDNAAKLSVFVVDASPANYDIAYSAMADFIELPF